MHVSALTLHDFRSYPEIAVELGPGPSAFVGRNGQGKTNLVEAVDYLSRLSSHRVSSDAPLVRAGAQRAVVQAEVVRDGRSALLEIEIHPGSSNKARINRSPLPRARELLGLVRTVVFSPEDLALVKGDPSDRRRFLDDLLVLRAPRYAGVRSDYDRVLRQRNTLLKTAGGARRGAQDGALATLEVWDSHLARTGAEILAGRVALVDALGPLVGKAYEQVARGARHDDATLDYKTALELPEGAAPARADLEQAILEALAERRKDELDRGVSLVGPHRDDLTLGLGPLPAKGYASHGESWSFALALRLASYDLLRADGDDPILVLDDVFAELDTRRRDQLAERVAGAEQVLVTAAVPGDVPAGLTGARYDVADGRVTRVG
ncbi:MAG: DNA replication/repair protein RecF [Nocardioides sp.]|nr:DNA replication/repair protein RecF [Nocardioides sp.]